MASHGASVDSCQTPRHGPLRSAVRRLLLWWALRCRTAVTSIDPPSSRLHLGHDGAGPAPNDRTPVVVMRPDIDTAWTEPAVQGLPGALLHEMTHAVLHVFRRRCADYLCLRIKALADGMTHHNHHTWTKLAQGIEKEARRSLLGFEQR